MINLKLIPEVGRSMRVEVLTTLKRSAAGHTVRELSDRFGMSYMGIKAHCVQLEREGLLLTERRPKPVGRPELVYRLTPRGHAVFSRADAPSTAATNAGRPLGGARLAADVLEAVRRAYGPAAADKLLFGVFARWAEDFRARLADCEDLPERAAGLARLRDEEGYLAALDGSPTLPAPSDQPVPGPGGPVIRDAHPPRAWTRAGVASSGSANPGDGPLRIVENGSPLEALLRVYPLIGRLERELFEKVLGCPVRRTQEETAPGVYRCVFELSARS